ALRGAVAADEGVPAAWALCGSGASDLIYRAVFAAKPRRALVTAPCFGEYEAALEAAGCDVVRYPLDGDFRLDAGVLDALRGVELAFFCQPNNPSGVPIDPALLRRAAEAPCRVVVDECFLRFLDAPEAHSVKPLLASHPNLAVLDAPTKTHALAGARLGWALCADAAFLGAMRRAGQPWAVSSLAQAAGIAALADADYLARLRALVRTERAWLHERLCALGLRVAAGEANFLLFRCETPLGPPLRARGILLRNCGDFAGLDENWYRAAVRTRADNERLIAAIGEALA
ncbi:MAG: aminotransferase class I/II-fold pyridoxal phosphate-dependent enzyme, partial [Oscillospiraceae bacterium]|nr:aminotransferase class I/II-fold pyridoxal phosphate-dependent enzyme [Oscillospiraceae bacterium]